MLMCNRWSRVIILLILPLDLRTKPSLFIHLKTSSPTSRGSSGGGVPEARRVTRSFYHLNITTSSWPCQTFICA